MNRREVIQRASLALGYAITGPALDGVLNGCKAEPKLTFSPQFFTKDQAALVSLLSEIIIPRTETPGAIDAGVPTFIDSLLKDAYTKEDQDNFIKNLTAFNDGSKNDHGNSFIECDKSEQLEYFRKLHDETVKTATGGGSSGFWNAANKNSKPFILELKELTLLGFFTSQPGATEVLQYKQVPGPFKGCVPLKEVGKTWAT
jgi:gluconate 2-dehydrogenase gamma chain